MTVNDWDLRFGELLALEPLSAVVGIVLVVRSNYGWERFEIAEA